MSVGNMVRLDLEAEPLSVPAARRFVRQTLNAWALEPAADAALLLTSELATNAVLHARTRFAVIVTHERGLVRVAVLDASPVLPTRRAASLSTATGRGIALVDSLASTWGVTPATELDGFSKAVWFTVPTDGTSASDGLWVDGF